MQDVSPNALQSSWNPDEGFIGLTPERTNSSWEERTDGWCGTTNDVSVTALGEIDTEDDNWLDEIKRAFLGFPTVKVDKDEIAQWVKNVEDAEEDYEDLYFECGQNTKRMSRSAIWNEDPDADGEWYPTPREGWMFLLGRDSEFECEFLERDELHQLEDILDYRLWEIVAEIMDVAGIENEFINHVTYDSSTHGEDWAYILIEEDSQDEAREIFEFMAYVMDKRDWTRNSHEFVRMTKIFAAAR
jgi:hypothetical protein